METPQADRPSYEELATFIDSFPDIACMLDETGHFLEVFTRDQGPIGEHVRKYKGQTVEACWGKEKAKALKNNIHDALETGRTQKVEYWQSIEAKDYCFEARITPLNSERGGKRVVQLIAFEITERKNLELALHQRDQLLEGIAKAKTLLLTIKDFEDALIRSLAIIGRSARVDRVYLFEREAINDEAVRYAKRFAWRSKHLQQFPEKHDIYGVNFSRWFPQWSERLEQNGVVRARYSQQDGLLRRLMHWRKAKSLLLLPVFIELELWGFIGFEDCRDERLWEYSEVASLRVVAGSIGAFIYNKRTEGMLREAKISADRANAAKGEFLAMMSHEIRTPMNSILGFSDLMLQSSLDETQKEYASIINRSGKTLLELINNILDYSKIESRGIDLEMEPFNLELCVLEVIQLLELKAREKAVGLKLDMPEDFAPTLVGDPGRLRQVLLNLISNALKFTEKGTVTVKVRLEKSTESPQLFNAYFDITDTGIGIDTEKISELFQPFSQVSGPGSARKFGGTGLGLVICKRLVNKMGGAISVSSEKGQGSTFSFNILLEAARDENTPLEIQEDESISHDFAEHYPLRILLAEDNPSNRDLAVKMLENLGYRVDVAHDGQETLDRIHAKPYDALLLDIQLPKLNGIEITQRLREGRLGMSRKNLYIVAVSASAMVEDRERFLEHGMNDFIIKPVDSIRLKQALAQAHATVHRV